MQRQTQSQTLFAPIKKDFGVCSDTPPRMLLVCCTATATTGGATEIAAAAEAFSHLGLQLSFQVAARFPFASLFVGATKKFRLLYKC
jgi:hypothetical protein